MIPTIQLHELSRLPGGQSIVIELANGKTLVSHAVKYPAPYITKVLEAELETDELNRDTLQAHIRLLAVGRWVVFPGYTPQIYRKLQRILAAHPNRQSIAY